jgi:hypothetical protein
MKKLSLLSILSILFIYGCSAEDQVIEKTCNCDRVYEQQTYSNATQEILSNWYTINTNANFTQDCSRDGEVSNSTSNNNASTQITTFKRNRIICK